MKGMVGSDDLPVGSGVYRIYRLGDGVLGISAKRNVLIFHVVADAWMRCKEGDFREICGFSFVWNDRFLSSAMQNVRVWISWCVLEMEGTGRARMNDVERAVNVDDFDDVPKWGGWSGECKQRKIFFAR